jgi:hypothetical protein
MQDKIHHTKVKQASEEKMAELIELIRSQCSTVTYWHGKVRKGYGAPAKGGNIPQGILQLWTLSENPHESQANLLKNIGKFADKKHSTCFQWIHSFFRGRDKKTNEYYGILAQLKNGPKPDVVERLIRELKTQFFDPASEKVTLFSNMD